MSAIASKPLHGNKLKMRGQQTVVEVAGFHSKLANSFSYFSCYVIAHNSVLWIKDKEVTARIDKMGNSRFEKKKLRKLLNSFKTKQKVNGEKKQEF